MGLKLGQLIHIEFDDAIMDDSEYIYLHQEGGVANLVEGSLTKMSTTQLPAYYISQTKEWLLVAWQHAPHGDEGRWVVTFRIPIKWIRSIRKVTLGPIIKIT